MERVEKNMKERNVFWKRLFDDPSGDRFGREGEGEGEEGKGRGV